MRNNWKTPKILLFFFFLLLYLHGYTQRIYLSGEDASDAVPWDFKISTGRSSGVWTTLPVPANWELHGFGYYTYAADHKGYQNDPEIGFYKRKFELHDIANKRLRLTFAGSMTDTHVKINGKSAGVVHRGGFMQFSYEITPLVKEGENLIEVEVHKSSEDENIQQAERISDFWLFGGIYRPVYIDVLPKELIDRVAVDARMDGDFKVDVYVNGIRKADRLVLTILDDQGNTVGKPIKEKVAPGDSLLRLHARFENIRQWSHEFPNLYRADIALFSGKTLVHLYQQKFGFRTFEVRDHDGFYLNGKRILLKGMAMHSIRPETGRALSKKDMEENFRLLKEMNCNAVRPCHYPADEYFYNLCDSLGLLSLCELTGWIHPLNTSNGRRLVKEMIVAEVSHPSIVLWSSSNHFSHNPALDEDFFKWDIQGRRPLKNASKSEEWPGNYHPDFDIVDTRYYPSYEELTQRLADTHIVFPNETLHALYDGGGAAGLYDYWEAFKSSKVGGGMIFWAMYDEGVVRTDSANRIDVAGNKGPDGLLGPNGEKEASYFAAREIWSPVQIPMTRVPQNFEGSINLKNDFTFVNLNQCRVAWQFINFNSKDEAAAGFRPVSKGVVVPGNIPAGAQGAVNIALPANWKTCDALRLRVIDNQGSDVLEKMLLIADRESLAGKFGTPVRGEIVRDSSDPFRFQVSNTTLKFDEKTGVLEEVKVNGKALPVGNAPFLVAKSAGDSAVFDHHEGSVRVSGSGQEYVIESKGNNSFEHFTWTISADGTLKLDYAYTLPEGKYYYAGIGFEVPSDSVSGKRWLGEGPYPVWKNRTEGGLLNVWDIEKHVSIPGREWNYPSFEGIFDQWYWAVIRFTGYQNMGISSTDGSQKLGVLNPKNGIDPRYATWHYPAKQGIYLFDAIPAVGAKWKRPEEHGPQSQPAEIGGTIRGTVQFNFSWNCPAPGSSSLDLGIN